MVLLERDDALAVLSHALDSSRTAGQLVAVSGEAGIGKSSLLQAFAARVAHQTRPLWGYCEAIATPPPLGPLLDMAPDLGGPTADALTSGLARHEIFAAFVASLARPSPPIVAFFEDVHWADEATLDLLQYISRRIHRTRSVVVISWRDDEVNADHPLHRVLGDWVHAAVHRIQLEPLSIPAVERLAAGARDAQALHALTGGNPFFVAEVLTSMNGAVPASVREAVLARRSRLDAEARAVLDLVSVVPSRADLALITSALGAAPVGLDACIAAGLLHCDPQAVQFRHELTRLAVANALSSPRAQDCHRRILEALLARADRDHVLARIVHHAEACGDLDALAQYAPAAARQAAAVGAHRQAVDHYRRALQHQALSQRERATLTEALAYELYLTGDDEGARQASRETLELWRSLDVPLAVGRNIRWLSRLAWFACDRDEADRRADEAIQVLSTLPASHELAMAMSNRAHLDMLNSDIGPCIAWGTKAIDLARTLDARDVLSHALNNVGSIRLQAGDIEGRAQLEESLRLALAGDFHEHAARAYLNLSSTAIENREYAEARRWVDEGIAYWAGRDLGWWTTCMLAWRARLRAETGHWQSACEDADAVLAAPRLAMVHRIPALAVLGLVYARRGDAAAQPAVDEALALARRIGEPQRLVTVLLIRAELAWLTGRYGDVKDAVQEGLQVLGPEKRAFDRERLWYWGWKVGAVHLRQVSGVGPYTQLIRGHWKTAASYWDEIGCPYERAEALLEGDLPAVQEALRLLLTLRASPAIDYARQRLRQMGVTRVPRGHRASTLAHPAGLTVRESEILAMLALGLRNAQIAKRLFVSPKTVERHVTSILTKLNAPTREAAVTHAKQEGWLA